MTVVLLVTDLLPLAPANAQQPSNQFGRAREVLLNDGWQYLEDPVENPGDLPKSKVPWVAVTLPHTWNAFDAVDPVPGYRRSASWYEKKLFVPGTVRDSRIILCFEGINITSTVYVNGTHAGGHIGGYVGYEVDITDFVRPKSSNTIDIRVDNSVNLDVIPSQKSDFFIYGGINRNVWLKVVAPQYLHSVKISTANVSKTGAATRLQLDIINATRLSKSLDIDVIIKDRSGRNVLRTEVRKECAAGTDAIAIEMPTIDKPDLWSPRDPALYTAAIYLKNGGKTIDSLFERYGYRWFEFKEHGPFFLNGERLLLRGTQRHEEYAGRGGAVPDSLQWKDIKLAKEVGANFLRLAHYPQARSVYRACDSLGILLWDELPWCRGGLGGEAWRNNVHRLLKEMIDQNFNHPSIIMWSLGNEVYWEPDHPGGDDPDSLRIFMKSLNDQAHALDPGRVTATRKFYDGNDIVDVFSPSIWSGWYSGVYHDYEKTITEARDKYNRLFHAEYGGDSHVGRHSETPVTGDGYLPSDGKDSNDAKTKIKNISLSSDWNENYIVNLFDWYLGVTRKLDWFTGSAQWILKDFGTPLRPENPIPYVNQKGLFDRAGTPKDAFYVYKSYWTTDPKFCYIESHTWTERTGPKGLKRLVKVYSNCDSVELVLNGNTLSKRWRDMNDFPACGLRWMVDFQEGPNTIQAIGYANGTKVAEDSVALKYSVTKSGDADHVVLTSQALPNGNYLVTALAYDKNGQRNLTYSKRIYFTSEGPGKLMQNYGTPTGSSIIEMANGKASIEFQPSTAGVAVIEARNQDFKGAYLRIGKEMNKK